MKANSEELVTFVAVVESGSFSRAAEQLEQDNSVVSRTIKRLEGKLGISLLNRTTRQVSLTHEGELYFRRVQRILQEMAAAESELLDNQHQPQGLLRVDAATPVTLHLLTPLMALFNQRFPHVRLSLISSESFINLIERKVDIAIRVGDLGDSSLRARKLMISYRHVLASPDYLKRRGVPTSVEQLSQHHCLGFNEVLSLNRWPLLQPDGQYYDIDPYITSNSGETLRQLALEGNGIVCLSDFMMARDIERGDLVPILTQQTLPIAVPIHAVYYSDHAVSNRIRCFIDFISEQIACRSAIPIPQGKERTATR